MFYVLAPNQVVDVYPYSITALKNDNPQISFPQIVPDSLLAEYNVYPVIRVDPVYDPRFQVAEPQNCIFTTRWETAWNIRSKTDEELNQYKAKLQDIIVSATQVRLDTFAKTRNYDSILSACTYATSTIPKFAQEGQYAVNSRDLTWAALYTIMQEISIGTIEIPNGYEDIEPSLPILSWPTPI